MLESHHFDGQQLFLSAYESKQASTPKCVLNQSEKGG